MYTYYELSLFLILIVLDKHSIFSYCVTVFILRYVLIFFYRDIFYIFVYYVLLILNNNLHRWRIKYFISLLYNIRACIVIGMLMYTYVAFSVIFIGFTITAENTTTLRYLIVNR